MKTSGVCQTAERGVRPPIGSERRHDWLSLGHQQREPAVPPERAQRRNERRNLEESDLTAPLNAPHANPSTNRKQSRSRALLRNPDRVVHDYYLRVERRAHRHGGDDRRRAAGYGAAHRRRWLGAERNRSGCDRRRQSQRRTGNGARDDHRIADYGSAQQRVQPAPGRSLHPAGDHRAVIVLAVSFDEFQKRRAA